MMFDDLPTLVLHHTTITKAKVCGCVCYYFTTKSWGELADALD